MSRSLRNIAIIAHVDHGKTTLVDELLRQSGAFRDNQRVDERAMDRNALERERGITILAKVTSVAWNDVRLNIVDTPGHADFGGEVERILSMVDGAVLLVDAAEGPMPQTKFVLSKALKVGLRPIVALNKIDKDEARPDAVVDEVFDLFAALGADEDQLDFPILYGSAKQGWMADAPDGPQDDVSPLFEKIVEHVSEPKTEDGPFRMLATTIEADPYLGRILTGRIASGTVKPIRSRYFDSRISSTSSSEKLTEIDAPSSSDDHSSARSSRPSCSARKMGCLSSSVAVALTDSFHSSKSASSWWRTAFANAMNFRVTSFPCSVVSNSSIDLNLAIDDRTRRKSEWDQLIAPAIGGWFFESGGASCPSSNICCTWATSFSYWRRMSTVLRSISRADASCAWI